MHTALVFYCLMGLAAAAAAQAPMANEADRAMLKTLRPGHPRLIGLESDLARVKGFVATDATARKWRDALRKEAEAQLTQPPVEHVLIGPRLLDKSRRALDRITTLSLMYRLDGDRRFAERALKEMLAVCAFKDWNPSHFLDTAEMTHAVAIGYDWLYGFLSPEDRATVRRGIVELGLKPGVEVYRKKGWWTADRFNWNQVCNGGMAIGALCLADEEPDLAAYVLGRAVAGLPKAMASYAPDGGWAEGPGYWNYATSYNVYALAALETALGTDFGLSKAPGFRQSGLFRLHFEGPTGKSFNFADAGDGVGNAPLLFWTAREYNRPLDAWLERTQVRNPTAYDLLWYDGRGRGPKAAKVPLDAYYKSIQAVFLRGAWEDPKATFIGFKGGDNAANHSHLDLGTFVLDADGVRWVLEPGPDDYNLPGYFGNKRWTYYRLKTAGQNTLSLDGRDQDPKAKAPIVAFGSKPERSFAVADLSAGYAGQATKVMRGVALLERKGLLVQDEIAAPSPVDPVWAVHTAADVKLDGPQATLRQAGQTMYVRIVAPADARFDVEMPQLGPGERPMPGVKRLVVRLPGKVTATRIAVLFTPGSTDGKATSAVKPLAEW